MKTFINKTSKVVLTITLVAMVAFVLFGNVYLAVINYRLQEAKGLFEKLAVMNDIAIGQPESFALAVHIMTVSLVFSAVVWFIGMRLVFRKIKIPNFIN